MPVTSWSVTSGPVTVTVISDLTISTHFGASSAGFGAGLGSGRGGGRGGHGLQARTSEERKEKEQSAVSSERQVSFE